MAVLAARPFEIHPFARCSGRAGQNRHALSVCALGFRLMAVLAVVFTASRSAAQETGLMTLALGAVELVGCSDVSATVILAAPAPALGAWLLLQSDTPSVRVPPRVYIDPGSDRAIFTVLTRPVRARTVARITASREGREAGATLEVLPAPAYTVEDLGALGGAASRAVAINAKGQVAGSFLATDGRMHGFRTGVDGAMSDIAPGRADAVYVAALNDTGQVAGWLQDSTGRRTAFFTDAGGALVPIVVRGAAHSQALGINDAGEVVGFFTTSGQEDRAFWMSASGSVTDLGTFPDGTRSYAFALTPDGAVVGFGDDGNRTYIFRTEPGGRLATAARIGPHTYGYAVNAEGTITGEVYNAADGAFHLFRVQPDGSGRDLGTLEGRDAAGYAINGRGEVAGATYILGGPEGHAILYTDEAGLRDLNDLIAPDAGWELVSATGINDAGQIAGYGRHDGAVRAFRLAPVVPPAPYGDVDGDGIIGAADVSHLLKMNGGLQRALDVLTGDVAPSPTCGPRGFGDGRIGMADAVRVLRRVRGGESAWP